MAISNTRRALLRSMYGDIKIDGTADTALAAITTSSTVNDVLVILNACVARNRVTDVNSIGYATNVQTSLAPTDIALSASALAASTAGNVTPVVIGTLSVTQPLSQSITYTLVSGTGDTKNSVYSISGSTLRYIGTGETAGTNSIRVRATTIGGQTYEEALTITVS